MFRSVLVFSFFLSFCFSQESRKVCSATPNDSACQQLARTPNLRCNYNQHNVDCLINIQNNQSHLGRITGEEAMLGSNLLSKNVVVLGEIRTFTPGTQTVVIVKNETPKDIKNWRGKKLCHPGYKHDESFPHFMLKEIEDWVIREINPPCQENVTLLERRINALSEFFNVSCRPGPWSESSKFDKMLKKKYSSLCELCGSAKCEVDYSEPFKNSLQCLVEQGADIALTTLNEAEKFFNTRSNKINYRYACKDGSSTNSFCIWSAKTSDLLVSETSAAKEIENYLRLNMGSFINTTRLKEPGNNIGESIAAVLNLKYEQVTMLEENDTPISLRTYIYSKIPTLPTPTSTGQCDRTLKWCTRTDEEQKKCQWLSQAAVLWGIEPVVECIKTSLDNELFCLKDIQEKRADLVVASSDYSYVALSEGLFGVAFPEVDAKDLLVTLVVKRAGDASIQSFQDMEDKRACFSRYGGREHLAFVDTLRNLEITSNQRCNYGRILSDYVGNSCIPGVESQVFEDSTQCVNKTKFCAQCRPFNISSSTTQSCNADANNLYFGDEGALRCLYDQQGDFAVITYTPHFKNDTNLTNLTVICKNNTLASFNGLNVDEECVLFSFTSSEVVVRTNDTKNKDIKLALYEFERWFGKNLKKSFHLFDRFENKRNFLFPDSTLGLNFDDSVTYIKNYKKLLRSAKRCNGDCNLNGSSIKTTSLLVFTFSIILVFIKF